MCQTTSATAASSGGNNGIEEQKETPSPPQANSAPAKQATPEAGPAAHAAEPPNHDNDNITGTGTGIILQQPTQTPQASLTTGEPAATSRLSRPLKLQ